MGGFLFWEHPKETFPSVLSQLRGFAMAVQKSEKTGFAEWTFEVIDGPSGCDLTTIAVCDTLKATCRREFYIKFKSHPHKWIGTEVRVRICGLDKIADEEWIIVGDWLDAKFVERPCSFKGTYSTRSKTGVITFSFEYGRLVADEEDGAV